jgi:hypothetical protein
MRYRLSLNLEGQAVTENGRVNVDIAGSPPRSTEPWRLKASFGREKASVDASATLSGPMGGELRGAYVSGEFSPVTDADGGIEAGRVDARFRVNESSGRFADSTGTMRLYGTMEAERVLLSVDLDLDAPETAWRPPDAVLLSNADAAGGASSSGLPSGTPLAAERDAERSIIEGAAHPRGQRTESGSQRP